MGEKLISLHEPTNVELQRWKTKKNQIIIREKSSLQIERVVLSFRCDGWIDVKSLFDLINSHISKYTLKYASASIRLKSANIYSICVSVSVCVCYFIEMRPSEFDEMVYVYDIYMCAYDGGWNR